MQKGNEGKVRRLLGKLWEKQLMDKLSSQASIPWGGKMAEICLLIFGQIGNQEWPEGFFSVVAHSFQTDDDTAVKLNHNHV